MKPEITSTTSEVEQKNYKLISEIFAFLMQCESACPEKMATASGSEGTASVTFKGDR